MAGPIRSDNISVFRAQLHTKSIDDKFEESLSHEIMTTMITMMTTCFLDMFLFRRESTVNNILIIIDVELASQLSLIFESLP